MLTNLLFFKKFTVRHVFKKQFLLTTLLGFYLFQGLAFAFQANINYEKALQAFHQQDFQSSIIHLKNILAEDANHLPSKVLMAENLLATGKIGAAEIELTEAIKAGADKYKITPLLAKAYLLQSNYQKILDIQIADNSTLTYQSIMQTYVGYAYIGQKHLLSANQAFNLALSLNPNNVEALIGLAKVHILQENREAVLPILEQVLQLDHEHKQALLMLTIVYQLNNQTNAALTTVNTLLLLDQHNYSALLTRAMLLLSVNKHEQAMADVNIIVEKLPNEPIANYVRLLAQQTNSAETANKQSATKKNQLHLMAILAAIPEQAKTEQPVFLFLTGLVNYQNNAMENAQKALVRYHKVAPDDLNALILLAKTEMALADFYSAKKHLVKAHLADENNIEVWSLLGRTYLTLNELDKAEFYFRKTLSAAPQNISAIIDLSSLYQIKADYAAMQTLLTPATQFDNDNKAQTTQLYLMLLTALQKLNQIDTALTYSSQLLAHDSQHSYAHQIHGTLLALQGKIAQARALYMRAIALDADNFQAVLYLARVEALLGNVNESIRLLKKSLAREPNSAIYIELGDVYSGANDDATSLVWYQKALALNPSSLLALEKITAILVNNNDLKQAINTTEKYLDSYSQNAQACQLLAQLYQQQGDYKKALANMQQYVKYASDRAAAFYQLAQLQLLANQRQAAITSLQKSKAWQADYQPAYLLLISIYTQQKAQQDALALITSFADIANDASLVARLRADVYWAVAQKENALNYYQQSYQLAKNREALLGIYRIYRQNQQYNLITKLLSSWLNETPDDLTMAISLAENYRQMGQHQQASQYYQTLIAQHADNAVILNNAAIVYQQAGQYEQAITLSNRAHQLMPNNVTVIDTKAWIEYQRGNYTQALALLRKASTLAFENAEVKYHLGATLLKLERTREGKQHLKEAVLSPQDFPEKQQAKALLHAL